MSDSAPAPSIELQIQPASSAFAPGDQRWQGQVSQLLQDLNRTAGPVRKDSTPQPGQKGGVEQIILALGTAGAIKAAVVVFKAWIARSADRTIRIKGTFKGQPIDIEISGRNVEEKSLEMLTDLLSK